jgi:hypothetical protein
MRKVNKYKNFGQNITIIFEGWVTMAKLVARMVATEALWAGIQTTFKKSKWATSKRGPKHLSLPKNIKKSSFNATVEAKPLTTLHNSWTVLGALFVKPKLQQKFRIALFISYISFTQRDSPKVRFLQMPTI